MKNDTEIFKADVGQTDIRWKTVIYHWQTGKSS